MKASAKIKNFIKTHEGLRLDAYTCPAGVLTIGYGHTGHDVRPGMRITLTEADTLFDRDLEQFETELSRHIADRGVTLSQHRYDAVVSFAYNVGVGNLLASTLWKKLCANPDDTTIPSEFCRWVYSKGSKLPGLVTRRRQEAQIYQHGKADNYE